MGREYIQAEITTLLLRGDERVTERAIIALYKRQESDEHATASMIHKNSIGFNAADAAPLSKLATKLMRGEKLTNGELHDAQQRLLKYSRQLMSIANEKEQ